MLSKFSYLCEWVIVVGSIRRCGSEVHDIDIVVIPALPRNENWDQIAEELGHAHNILEIKKGPKLMSFAHYSNDVPDFPQRERTPDYTVDVYRATHETWGILCLIRTGSKEHNVKLCQLALSKGMKLSAKDGLQKPVEGFPAMMQMVAAKTEEEIFAGLGLPFVEPKDREVPAP